MPGSLLLRTADADRDGRVAAEEWTAFTSALTRRDDGTLDAADFKRRHLRFLLDTDRDGKLTRADLEPIFAPLDPDAGNSGRQSGTVNRLVVMAADADKSGDVTMAEWQAFTATLPEHDAISDATLAGWIQAAEAAAPAADERPGAMTPAVWLMTIERGLDADQNGRLEPADLQAAFDAADQNKDGAIDEAELTRRGRAGRNAGGAGRGGFGVDVALRRKLPPLVPWQRSLDDALALQQTTGQPLLACVNMDDEPASESLAWGRYRDPEFAKLAQGFVCLIVSPNRRNARDYDDRGRRIVDARFGRVTNAEHIDIEPALYERYFQGQRVAPRHLAVDKDGKILFDIYLTQGLEPIDEALAKHGKPAPQPPSGDLELTLLGSPDAGHREALEAHFVAADQATRLRLASAAFAADRRVQHPEVLRLALFDPAPAVRKRGAQTLADHLERAPLPLFVEGLRIAHGDGEITERFAAALLRCAGAATDETTRKGARRLHSVIAGLAAASTAIDVARWKAALETGTTEPTPSDDDLDALSETLEKLDKRAKASPQAGDVQLELAAATLRFARIRLLQGKDAGLLLEDARSAATRALGLGAAKGLAQGCIAWASLLLGDQRTAAPAAEAALPELAPQASSAMAAAVLEVLAGARVRAVYSALDTDGAAPAHLVADARAAFDVLLAHPQASEATAAAYLDFLDTLEAYGPFGDVVRRAVSRWPLAGRLHEHQRAQLLREGGADALEAAYGPAKPAEASAAQTWYAGLATLVAAERRVQNRDLPGALASYRRSVGRFDAAIESDPSLYDSAQHYASLALAGRARLHAEGGDLAAAAQAAREALERRAESAAVPDGLGITPAQSAVQVVRALNAAGRADDAKALRDAAAAAGVTLDMASAGRDR